MQGAEVAITTHAPYFPIGSSSTDSLSWVWEYVMHSYTNDNKNIAQPESAPT